ncbi:RHO protein GDP dissociation inhibitor [Niveomyces insectorum RCEF 264]|uniref:RHO protein GDP dissociation inhibitor n=1 Tax=Niveomyces insectorum RCEF 264 TaxID=1081102 RepID=A0A167PVU3_9HYPO|nr:RHO protein GDP dissociation inhibitor [Niveomyces insectorum RCEF 264]
MSITTARSRSVSVSVTVPAPPPPTPHHDALSEKPTTYVTAVDLDRMLRLLSCENRSTSATPAVSPASSVTVSRAASCSASSSASAAVSAAVSAAASAAVSAASLLPLASSPVPNTSNHNDSKTDVLTTTASGPAERGRDANDESLQRYKESLGLGGGGKDLSDPNDPRVCIIQSLTMESPGRDPVTIDLSVAGSEATLKDKPFTIKEGARFTMMVTFKVQHEVLSGLRYVQIVKRKGLRVSKDSEMIGSYAPCTDKQPLYTKRLTEDEAPSGMLARGHYNALSTFVDDDKKTHLSFEWSFVIAKDW